jgi:3-deoxy-D-arabino-heptulosonate 7-phosphate (DAHP) synthase class II
MNHQPLTQFLDYTAALILETEEAMERVEIATEEWYTLSDRLFWLDGARDAAEILARKLGVET